MAPPPSMFGQMDDYKLYDAFLTLVAGIAENLFSKDTLNRVREEIVLYSEYEYEEEHIVSMVRGILNALDTEIATRNSLAKIVRKRKP